MDGFQVDGYELAEIGNCQLRYLTMGVSVTEARRSPKPQAQVQLLDAQQRKKIMATYRPPQGVADAAKRALEWIKEGRAGQGFTDVGRARAVQLANRQSVSEDTIKRMRSYFARHEVDKQGKGFNGSEPTYPSPGRVAWDAWGGDPGKRWVNDIKLTGE